MSQSLQSLVVVRMSQSLESVVVVRMSQSSESLVAVRMSQQSTDHLSLQLLFTVVCKLQISVFKRMSSFNLDLNSAAEEAKYLNSANTNKKLSYRRQTALHPV